MPPEPEGAPDVALTTALWLWRGTRADGTPTPAGWTFATIAGDAANAVRHAAAMGYTGRAAFGSVKVRAQIGATLFATSLFPHRESGAYLLPVKAAVRHTEGVAAGDEVAIRLWL